MLHSTCQIESIWSVWHYHLTKVRFSLPKRSVTWADWSWLLGNRPDVIATPWLHFASLANKAFSSDRSKVAGLPTALLGTRMSAGQE